MTFNIYVPSYKRYDAILTDRTVEYCTYVVRKSEEQAYCDAGVRNVLAVEDSEIDSLVKVHNWILENTPEDVVCLIDDDVEGYSYRTDTLKKIDSTEQATIEIERLAQLLYDLDIGYAATPSDISLMYYDRPFKFVGVTGQLKIFNKKALKTRFQEGLKFLCDMEFELQELLRNRIILIPEYFCNHAHMDTNSGGNNEQKSLSMFNAENEIMKQKWGKYYIKADGGKAGRLKVDR